MATNRPLHALINSSGNLGPGNRSSSSLITPALSALADPPTQHKVDAQLVQFLTHEVIRLLIDSEAAARTRRRAQEQAVEDELAEMGLTDDGSAGVKRDKGKGKQKTREEEVKEQDEADEAVRARLERMGFKVGWATAERLARDRPLFPSTTPAPAPGSSPSQSAPPVPDTLELVKFLCKDVWTALYDKQVDNLRTNHRGVYVLLDQQFRGLKGLSRPAPGDKEGERETGRWVGFILAFPSGVLRGALANLGVASVTVTPESQGLTQATFQIKASR
ncbi:hypothetical protein JCM10207_002781 [Rhodosporidiobolus poonsookiae]